MSNTKTVTVWFRSDAPPVDPRVAALRAETAQAWKHPPYFGSAGRIAAVKAASAFLDAAPTPAAVRFFAASEWAILVRCEALSLASLALAAHLSESEIRRRVLDRCGWRRRKDESRLDYRLRVARWLIDIHRYGWDDAIHGADEGAG